MDEVEQTEAPLPDDVIVALRERGLPSAGEVALRRALERYVPGYSLYRQLPAAVKRWKVRYQLMAGASYYDGQSAAEAYARALLASVDSASRLTS